MSSLLVFVGSGSFAEIRTMVGKKAAVEERTFGCTFWPPSRHNTTV